MSLRQAAATALDVLRAIQSLDASSGIDDPDVRGAVYDLETALKPGERKTVTTARPNRFGFVLGSRMTVRGGPLAGCVVTFAGMAGSDRVYVQHDGKRATVAAKLVGVV